MDVEHQHIRVGWLGKLIAGGTVTAVVTLLGWLCLTTSQLVTQMAVTSNQLASIQSQIGDVQSLSRAMAQVQQQVSRNTADLHDILQQRMREDRHAQ